MKKSAGRFDIVRFISLKPFYNDLTEGGMAMMRWILPIAAVLLQVGFYYYGQGGSDNV